MASSKTPKKTLYDSLLLAREGDSATKTGKMLTVAQDLAHGKTTGATFEMVFHYISDVHLEHQVLARLPKRTSDAGVLAAVDRYVEEMVGAAGEKYRFAYGECLLVAGDVACDVRLARRFYERCGELFLGGIVIGVLGNHELWGYATPEKALEEYKAELEYTKLLENELFVCLETSATDRGTRWLTRLSEERILGTGIEDLTDLLHRCSLIVLGGLGYTGNTPEWGAERGIYRSAVTSSDEDRSRSARFERLHEKVRRCAGDLPVIVLTHTPIEEWTHEPPQPGWSYVFGHTHESRYQKVDGATIYADNQVGYEPVSPRLRRFYARCDYDPLNWLPDGIHPIANETYARFLRGRGVNSAGCSYQGQIYVLKRDGTYMFVLETEKTLCILDGGARKRLKTKDKSYYFGNMAAYVRRIEELLGPYNECLGQIAQAVRQAGGLGTRHGCIVDVDWHNHVYLNPFDGTITPYWALDTENKVAYPSFRELIADRRPDLLGRYLGDGGEGIRRFEGLLATSGLIEQPELVLDKSMYEPSRIMRKVQYLVDDGVIRIWRDGILPDPPKLPAAGTRSRLNRGEGQTPSFKAKGLGDRKPPECASGQGDRLSPVNGVRTARGGRERSMVRGTDFSTAVKERSGGNLCVDPRDYRGLTERVIVSCNHCGKVWSPRAETLLERCQCPRCGKGAPGA